jgi:hypothetical protein
MASLPERNTPFHPQLVSLAPNSDEQQTDENLEPPFVRVRSGNECFIFADSEVRETPLGTPQSLAPDLFNATSFSLGGGNHQFYARKLKRLSVSGIQIANCVPNVNPRNNAVSFFSSASGLTHTVSIPEGQYATRATLTAALQTALNTATGASGLTWTITVNPLNSCQYTLATAGGNYRFVLTSPMVLYGRYLFNLPQEQALSNSKTMGAVYGLYTRYIDVISASMTEYTKNPWSSNTRVPNGLVARVFIGPQAGFGSSAGGIASDGMSFFAGVEAAPINYNRSRAIEVIDLALRDEFGQPYYIPSYSSGSPPNSALDLIIKAEL